jgi:hypothetical protein
MAKAGIENYDGLEHDAEFEAVISEHTSEVRQLARAVRRLVYDVLPQTVEVVWPHQGSVGWGTGPKKMSEQFSYLQAFKSHVGFGFYYGSELPDPTGLFGRPSSNKGTMRSIRITSEQQLDDPVLRDLVEAATTHRVPPPRH